MRWAAPLVAALCLCWSIPPAAARTLVGNTGQPTATGSSPVFALQSMAMQFSTGASGGPAGWLIGDSRLTNQGSGWTASTSNLKLKMAVLGHTASNDATLGALTLVDGAGNAIDLQPGFAAGATSYTAAVDHSVSSATVTAIATDTAATVSIANDDDESTPGTAGLGLEVGANTVTVKVTAADAATTGSYTVTRIFGANYLT